MLEVMNDRRTSEIAPLERVAERKARLAQIREHARGLFEGGAPGIQVAADLSAGIDRFVVDLFVSELSEFTPRERAQIEAGAAVVAIGGSGRGEVAPYSDCDLLFLYRGPVRPLFHDCIGRVVPAFWDAGLKLGQSLRTISESVALARQDPQIATSLVEARLLWGSRPLFDRFQRAFYRKVVRRRRLAFIADCIRARQQEQAQHGSTVQQLEPDVKRALGGLRDVHLIRWIGFARFGTANIESLRLQGALSKEDARQLLAAYEFLTRVRIDLHFRAGRQQEILNREMQLRMAEERGIEATAGQRPVERFMQTYFRHSSAIAEIARRFAAMHQPRSLAERLVGSVVTHRSNGIFRVGRGTVDVLPRHRKRLCGNLEQALELFQTAVRYGVRPAPPMLAALKASVETLDAELSPESIRRFLGILRETTGLGDVLRQMYEVGVLELILPDMKHARSLIQFNHYHSYTVDEHTLRAVEAAIAFERDESPVGTAYRAIHDKEILHLALLLHDLGKGYEEDHSEVGRRIAERTAARLSLTDQQRDALVFLVHKHLKMAHLAFRRNTSDLDVLIPFAQEAGSPEVLRMLYVLTAADLSGVGPGVWTDWKAELLTGLFDNAMLILSGKHSRFQEQERLRSLKEQVWTAMAGSATEAEARELREWLDMQLDAFPPHYLGVTPVPEIAADLDVIRDLAPHEVHVDAKVEPETGTVLYRLITHEEYADGVFHKTCGVLTASRLEILSAQISTSLDGFVVDSYRVVDHDYVGEVPPERTERVAEALRRALTGATNVQSLFQKHVRFGARRQPAPVSDQQTRVVIDNHSSDRCTIVDVFAHDRSGLLFTITRSIYEMGLSVMLAKISTHLDQIVDVFYVTEQDGRKVTDPARLRAIHGELAAKLEEFEREGYQQFV